MSEYNIPEEFYFRIHHVRPRFKGDIENVLIYMAEEITAVGEQPVDEFVKKVNAAIYRYPGNAHRKLKTINNWRTEISALFGFVEHTGTTDKPGRRAIELADNQDLVECFKTYLYNFQYPGAHIKPRNVLEQIEAGIHFKPAQCILKLLKYANCNAGNSIGLTKYEACHCVFNDLRVTRDNEPIEETWNRISENRKAKMEYDQTGDVIRYAGDIIDYMEIANLLKTYDSHTYYLNTLEEEAIIKFIESTEWFAEYDPMIEKREGTIETVKECINEWFSYVNRDIKNTDFSTDILAYIASDEKELQELKDNATTETVGGLADLIEHDNIFKKRIASYYDNFTTKDIGNIGESLVHGHECMRIKIGGREDLIHLIKCIPTQFAVGYDISSVELDERKRYIEVKTTISSKPLHFNRVHLTKNEWNTASSTHDRYYVYRLMLSKNERKLFLLQDPVGLYKQDLLDMIPSDGADITFDPSKVGEFEELLTWKN
jgi:hypothetical protein